jgi:membrane fusion protein, heavy metal efflux system
MIKVWLVIAGIACGVVLTSLALRSPVGGLPWMAWLTGEATQAGAARDAGHHDHHDDEGVIKLSEQQIAAAGIETDQAKAGVLSRRRFVPGLVTPSGDRVARVAVRLLGTVVELRKRLGDPVERNEVVAVIESRKWPTPRANTWQPD